MPTSNKGQTTVKDYTENTFFLQTALNSKCLIAIKTIKNSRVKLWCDLFHIE